MHKNQFGLAYLLQGKCTIKTYTITENKHELFSLALNAEKTFISHSYAILTPKINAHEILAIEDSTFLDIFAPGGAERISDYLEVIKSDKTGINLTVRRIAISEVNLPISLINNMGSFTEIS